MNFKNMGSEGGKAAAPATPLARQLSVYSLTFDEFQSTLGAPGKDFGSMNMDEFLRNIWTAEETHAMASAIGGGGAYSASADSAAAGGGGASASGLQRQGSLTLPRTLSQKTVDEVWRDLLRESGSAGTEAQQPRRQPTLGEMTLEEFLVRAGVVREDVNQTQPQPPQRQNNATHSNNNIFFGDLSNTNSNGVKNNNPGLTLGFSQTPAGRSAAGVVHSQIHNGSTAGAAATRSFPVPLQPRGNVEIGGQQGMRAGGITGMGDPVMNNGLMSGVMGLGGGGGVTVTTLGSPDGGLTKGNGNGDLSSLSPVPYMFGTGVRWRKSGAVEKVVERRQRRMIKNRESAARSRARKQAYTMELEAEVAKLKEQNEELQKKQKEIMEIQKNQVMEMINQQRGPKKLCLRRTQTGPW